MTPIPRGRQDAPAVSQDMPPLPKLPQKVIERFPEMAAYQRDMERWYASLRTKMEQHFRLK